MTHVNVNFDVLLAINSSKSPIGKRHLLLGTEGQIRCRRHTFISICIFIIVIVIIMIIRLAVMKQLLLLLKTAIESGYQFGMRCLFLLGIRILIFTEKT